MNVSVLTNEVGAPIMDSDKLATLLLNLYADRQKQIGTMPFLDELEGACVRLDIPKADSHQIFLMVSMLNQLVTSA